MKKILLTGSFIFFVNLVFIASFIFFVNLLFAGSSPKKLLLATQEWPPYQTYDNNILNGVAVRVVECALKKMNQPYVINVFPWKRAQMLVEKGKYHGFFAASKNNTRDQYAVQSGVIAAQKWKWYILNDSSLDPGDTSFKEKASVSARAGSNMRSWLEKNGYNVKTQPQTTEVLFRMLEIKRVDAILASEMVAKDVIVKLNLSDKINTVLNRNKPLGVYFSKKFLDDYPQFLNQFNELVLECR